MTLQKSIEQIVADVFSAGAEWLALHSGIDSAKTSKMMREWEGEHLYRATLARQQAAAVHRIAQDLMRLRLAPKAAQAGLFDEEASDRDNPRVEVRIERVAEEVAG